MFFSLDSQGTTNSKHQNKTAQLDIRKLVRDLETDESTSMKEVGGVECKRTENILFILQKL